MSRPPSISFMEYKHQIIYLIYKLEEVVEHNGWLISPFYSAANMGTLCVLENWGKKSPLC